jgi:hypothetical protein
MTKKRESRKDLQCFGESEPFRLESRRPFHFRFLAVLQNRNVKSLVLGSLLQHTPLNIQSLTMELSSLNADALLYLMEFVDPVDRFNLVLSGILKGFENVNKGIDLRERYSEHFTSVSSCSPTVFCLESIIVELNWGYVVIARASSKSG